MHGKAQPVVCLLVVGSAASGWQFTWWVLRWACSRDGDWPKFYKIGGQHEMADSDVDSKQAGDSEGRCARTSFMTSRKFPNAFRTKMS